MQQINTGFKECDKLNKTIETYNKEFKALERLALINTGTMRDLFTSADKAHNQTHGKFWATIDSRQSYIETGMFAIARCAKHVALMIVSILGIPFAKGRQFFYENLCRSFLDLTGFFISLVGVISLDVAMYLTAAEIRIFDRQLGAQAYITKKLNEQLKVAVDRLNADQAGPHRTQTQIRKLAKHKRELEHLTQASIQFVHRFAGELGSYEVIKIYQVALIIVDSAEAVMDAGFLKDRFDHYAKPDTRPESQIASVKRHMQQLFNGIEKVLDAQIEEAVDLPCQEVDSPSGEELQRRQYSRCAGGPHKTEDVFHTAESDF